MMKYYILDNRTPVEVDEGDCTQTMLKWGMWYGTADRTVKKTRMEVTVENRFTLRAKKLGFIEVSTIFTGLDHGHGWTKKPLLFETMIFGGEFDKQCWRCCTWGEAEQQHEEICELLKAGKLGNGES